MRAGLAALALSAIGLAGSGTANAADHVVTPAGVAGTMIQNFNTHNCLDDSETYGVRAIPCVDGNTHQQWTYEDFAGRFITKNGYTHRCLDDSVTYGLRAISCDDGNPHQRFYYLRDITNADIYPGFQIESEELSLCLDDSPTYGVRNAPCTFEYNDHQRWFSLVF
jgi:hypothetical protein